MGRWATRLPEFYADGHWCMSDSSYFCVFPDEQGRLLSAAELHTPGHKPLVARAYLAHCEEVLKLSDEQLESQARRQGPQSDRRLEGQTGKKCPGRTARYPGATGLRMFRRVELSPAALAPGRAGDACQYRRQGQAGRQCQAGQT